MVAEWTTVSPWSASAGVWFQWVVQHQVVAGVAVAVALFPSGTRQLLRGVSRRANVGLRALVLVAAASIVWSPPPFAGEGLDGLVNQLLYVAGAPVAWGPLSPGGLSGIALAVRWAWEYALLAGVGIAVALRPDAFLGRLVASTAALGEETEAGDASAIGRMGRRSAPAASSPSQAPSAVSRSP